MPNVCQDDDTAETCVFYDDFNEGEEKLPRLLVSVDQKIEAIPIGWNPIGAYTFNFIIIDLETDSVAA